MSRTVRSYHDRMCLRNYSNRPHKVEQSTLRDIQRDIELNFYLGNRALYKEIPESREDKYISALNETKYIWKHDQRQKGKTRRQRCA